MNEKIINKIQKLLALSSNNPNKSEAENAALKAQKLISEYNIQISEIEENEKDHIGYITSLVGTGKAWKYPLSSIVADNFRCKCFWMDKRSVAFYGYEIDAQAANQVFNYLFKMGNLLAEREVMRSYQRFGSSKYVRNSFLTGFVYGIKQKLDEQSTALMLVISNEVEDEFKDFCDQEDLTKEVKLNSQDRINRDAYYKGMEEGSNAMDSRRKQIEAYV